MITKENVSKIVELYNEKKAGYDKKVDTLNALMLQEKQLINRELKKLKNNLAVIGEELEAGGFSKEELCRPPRMATYIPCYALSFLHNSPDGVKDYFRVSVYKTNIKFNDPSTAALTGRKYEKVDPYFGALFESGTPSNLAVLADINNNWEEYHDQILNRYLEKVAKEAAQSELHRGYAHDPRRVSGDMDDIDHEIEKLRASIDTVNVDDIDKDDIDNDDIDKGID